MQLQRKQLHSVGIQGPTWYYRIMVVVVHKPCSKFFSAHLDTVVSCTITPESAKVTLV